MNTKEAIAKHAEWTFKFRHAVLKNQKLDPTAIARDNQCDFGRWLYGEGQSLFGGNHIHARCLAEHAAFHREAAKVAEAVNSYTKDHVERLLAPGSSYHNASKQVCVTIVELGNLCAR